MARSCCDEAFVLRWAQFETMCVDSWCFVRVTDRIGGHCQAMEESAFEKRRYALTDMAARAGVSLVE